MENKFNPECLRKIANWTSIKSYHKFDKGEDKFNPAQTASNVETFSPKYLKLLQNIKEADENDMKQHGKVFKHFIFSDLTQNGAKMVAATLLANNYKLIYNSKIDLLSDSELLKNKSNNFALLLGTNLYDRPINVKAKKEILSKFNQRPENIYGELCRFIILDKSFKEGIDLFDVKYAHILEPQTSKADLRQAIGRGTRLCGSKGLEFHPTQGWPLNVLLYDVDLPPDISQMLGTNTLYNLFLKNSNIDLKKLIFADELEGATIHASVDYELTKTVHRFEIGSDEATDLSWLFPKLEGGNSNEEISCKAGCKSRPTKKVPVGTPLLTAVIFAYGRELPNLRKSKPREYYCKLLKKDPKFCEEVRQAWKDPIAFIKKNKDTIINSVKSRKHYNLPDYNRDTFLRLIYEVIPELKKKKQLKTKLIASEKVADQVKSEKVQSEKSDQVKSEKSADQVKSEKVDQVKNNTVKSEKVQSEKVDQVKNNTVKSEKVADQVKNNTIVNVAVAQAQSNKIDSSASENKSDILLQEAPDESKKIIPIKENPGFLDIRQYVRENLSQFTWPKVKLENLCGPPPTKGGAPSTIVNFTPTQDFVRNYFTPSNPIKGMLAWHSVGTGKCWKKDTPILMFNGSIKMVQDIVVGDLVMGDDSTSRDVLSLGQGEDDMYDIIPTKGDKYTVNSEHILVLKNIISDDIIEIEVKDYLELDESVKQNLKGIRTKVEFKPIEIDDDPYTFAKLQYSIPYRYKCNSTDVRLNVLAGIIDLYGMYDSTNKFISLKTISEALTKDILYISRSLGFDAFMQDELIYISGNINTIPSKIFEIKEESNDIALIHDIDVKYVGKDNYYGFTLNGNNRLLMGDFTITHNTCMAIATATSGFETEGYTILWVTRSSLKSDIWKNMFDQVCSSSLQEKMKNGLTIPYDSASRMRLLSKAWSIRPMSYKQFSNLVAAKNSFYEDLVKKNGNEDPLRKTLLIIDEAHKLYGGDDLSSLERPDMNKFHKAVMHSYKFSGKDSVRLLMMTGTPITNDPLEMIKLLNLGREEDKQLPDNFVEFGKLYLDENGKFTKKGKWQYLNDIAGQVSYLTRERDARQFPQPILTPINVELSKQNTKDSEALTKLNNEYKDVIGDKTLEKDNVKGDINVIKQKYKLAIKELKGKCKGLKKEELEKCKNNLVTEIEKSNENMQNEIKEKEESKVDLTSEVKKLKADYKKKMKSISADSSQLGYLFDKCIIKPKKIKVKKIKINSALSEYNVPLTPTPQMPQVKPQSISPQAAIPAPQVKTQAMPAPVKI
jgi:hypothetical protein